jgi:hypothetical protein
MKHEREDYNQRVVFTDGSIPEEEPVFLLRGKDFWAHKIVRIWAMFHPCTKEKRERVLAHADKMEKWANDNHDTGCTS